MRLKIKNEEEPYGELIYNYINRQFPYVAQMQNCELVEAVSNVLIGTKEVRYGSLPNPEHLVNLRSIIRELIKKEIAIPVLVPWGSIKANFTANLDIAEIAALQRLVCLTEDVKRYYPQGLEVVIRVEDTSGYSLFQLEGNQAEIKEAIDSYSWDMKKIVRMLSPDGTIRVQLESEMENEYKYKCTSERCAHLIEKYLVASKNLIQFAPAKAEELPEYEALKAEGWKGIISYEQRQHYLSAYQRLYEDWSEEKMIKRLALYFGGAWARHLLGMTGKQGYWDKFIQLAFVAPIKGLPTGYNHNYVYYRTLPLSDARTHIPPWRAKGYLRIVGNEITRKITTFGDSETAAQLTPLQVVFYDSGATVSVNADYLLE